MCSGFALCCFFEISLIVCPCPHVSSLLRSLVQLSSPARSGSSSLPPLFASSFSLSDLPPSQFLDQLTAGLPAWLHTLTGPPRPSLVWVDDGCVCWADHSQVSNSYYQHLASSYHLVSYHHQCFDGLLSVSFSRLPFTSSSLLTFVSFSHADPLDVCVCK